MPESNIEQKNSTTGVLLLPESATAKGVKALVFCIVSLFLVVGNFFLEEKLAQGRELSGPELEGLAYESENIIPDYGVLRFSLDEGVPDPVMRLDSVDGREYVFILESGRVWSNFVASNADVNIVAGSVVLMPDHASFDLLFDGENLNLSVFSGDVYLGFLPEDVALTAYTDSYSGIFLNRLLVPRDTSVSISLRKVNEDIRPLLSTKLSKEFKYAAIPATVRDSEWVRDNLGEDGRLLESFRQEFISRTLAHGDSSSEHLFADFIFWAEEYFSFVPDKKVEVTFDHLFAYLDDAVYLASDGQEAPSRDSLAKFDAYLAGAARVESDEYDVRYDDYLDDLLLFGAEGGEYALLLELLERKFQTGRDVTDVVNRLWNFVYRAIDKGDVVAWDAVERYYGYFEKSMTFDMDPDFYRIYLGDHNQLFDNLFVRSSMFFRDKYFEMKNTMEQSLLAAYSAGQFQDELRQSFISNKIVFLKRLKKFFFDGLMEVAEARQIFSRLVAEVDALMPSDSSDLAVVSLFESQLKDIGDFWGYLNSPQYHTRLYGSTHEERYAVYLEERDKIWSFINIQEDVLGDATVSEEDVLDVVDEVKAALSVESELYDVVVGEVESMDQRYVDVSAVIGGYPFAAVYDRDTDLLKDVVAFDEEISDRGIKIASLLPVLQSRFADLAQKQDDEEEVTIETSAQRYARVFVAETVAGAGFEAEMENVAKIGDSQALYRVESVKFAGAGDVLVTFDINMTGEIANNIFLSIAGRPAVLDGEYTLEELASVVEARKNVGTENEVDISELQPADAVEEFVDFGDVF